MNPPPVFAKGRDLDATAELLRPWLADRFETADPVLENLEYPQGAGVSNETILLRVRAGGRTHDLVLRIAPGAEHQMFHDPKFPLQYEILVALHAQRTVLVPEPSGELLGRPFYLMRRLHGRVPVSMPVYNASGWLADATPAQRRTLWADAVAQLAAIHRTPAATVSFVDRPEHGRAGDAQQLSYWRAHAEWTLNGAVPDTVTALFDWLHEHRPPPSPPGLSWGDARIGNMMFGSDFRVTGVLDWEQVSLAGPVADLAWWLLFDEAHSVGRGLPRLPGLGDRAETIDLWRELTGLEPVNLAWQGVFAAVKAGLLSLRSRRMRRVLPPVSGPRYSFLGRACELAGVADPALELL